MRYGTKEKGRTQYRTYLHLAHALCLPFAWQKWFWHHRFSGFISAKRNPQRESTSGMLKRKHDKGWRTLARVDRPLGKFQARVKVVQTLFKPKFNSTQLTCLKPTKKVPPSSRSRNLSRASRQIVALKFSILGPKRDLDVRKNFFEDTNQGMHPSR